MDNDTLSLPDCFALSCATRDGYQLVTNDKALRSEAQPSLTKRPKRTKHDLRVT